MTMHSKRSGFSLVEMIVSVGLFAIVMLVATGAYLSLISLDRKARATNDLVTNLSFSIDTMERTLRAGSDFHCGTGTNCPGGGDTSLTFTDDQGRTITYRYDSTHRAIGQCINNGSCTDSTNEVLTDPRVRILNMQFYVRGVGAGDFQQPWAVFTVTGTLTPDSTSGPITFTIQSTAAQRTIEL